MDVTFVGRLQRMYGNIFNNCNYNVGVMSLSNLQVQAANGVLDLTSWLEFLQNRLRSLDMHGQDLMVAFWEGIWNQQI